MLLRGVDLFRYSKLFEKSFRPKNLKICRLDKINIKSSSLFFNLEKKNTKKRRTNKTQAFEQKLFFNVQQISLLFYLFIYLNVYKINLIL